MEFQEVVDPIVPVPILLDLRSGFRSEDGSQASPGPAYRAARLLRPLDLVLRTLGTGWRGGVVRRRIRVHIPVVVVLCPAYPRQQAYRYHEKNTHDSLHRMTFPPATVHDPRTKSLSKSNLGRDLFSKRFSPDSFFASESVSVVREGGLEPPWVAPPDPKSGASAKFRHSRGRL